MGKRINKTSRAGASDLRISWAVTRPLAVMMAAGLMIGQSGMAAAPASAPVPPTRSSGAHKPDASGAPSFQSAFISDPTFGKDPFFPDSKRRLGQPVVRSAGPVVKPAPDSLEPTWELLSLKGISLNANKRLAIINHYTFAEGEEREIKVANQVIKVRCVAIQERSAVLNIRGRTKELKLREGL